MFFSCSIIVHIAIYNHESLPFVIRKEIHFYDALYNSSSGVIALFHEVLLFFHDVRSETIFLNELQKKIFTKLGQCLTPKCLKFQNDPYHR